MKVRRLDDHHVATRDGAKLRVRTLVPDGVEPRGVLVLVHGIAAPLEPTYDLPVPGYSFLEELAGRGYCTVAFDHRNFGRSSRAPALAEPPVADEGRGLQTLDDSVEDIRAVVEDTCARRGVPHLTLFGSSRGAIQVLAFAATEGARRLELAILNNPSTLCYLSGSTEGPALAAMREEREGARRETNYTPYTADYQRRRWKKLFGDKETVDASLQEAYIAACIASDEEGARQSPPVFRVPTESFPTREPLVDLSRLGAPVLVVEAEEVSAEDVARFVAASPPGRVRQVFIHDSNHFTLRNEHRFELANLIDVAMTAQRWSPSR